MVTQLPGDLLDFARASGYEASPCPDCAASAQQESCANCGGSGRLWVSPRGSLSDAGLVRLKQLVG